MNDASVEATPPESGLIVMDVVGSYHERTRFTVVYDHPDGEPPRDASGAVSAPVVLVDGVEQEMHAPLGGLDHEQGVEYHVRLALPEGSHEVVYRAYDEFGNLIEREGFVLVKGNVAWDNDLREGARGSLPDGFSRLSMPGYVDFWHLSAGDDPKFLYEARLGARENILWFADQRHGDYQDLYGGTPGGQVAMDSFDLRGVEHPVLSFSSYYETEDLGSENNV